MRRNLGLADRGIRMFLAILVIDLFIMHAISGILAIVLLIMAGILLVTGFIGFCPIYSFFGISTNKKHLFTKKNKDDDTRSRDPMDG